MKRDRTFKDQSSKLAKKQRRVETQNNPYSAMNRGVNQTARANNSIALRTGGWRSPSTMNSEKKYKDVDSGIAIVASSGIWDTAGVLLNGVALGSAANERIGRKLQMKSIYIRWSANIALTSLGGSPFRILVVYDKQANATAPLIADILDQDKFNSPNNLANRDRFITLFDQMTSNMSSLNDRCVTGVLAKKINLEQMYNSGTTGVIGSITTGSIYIFCAQSGTFTTTNGALAFISRVRYLD